MDDETDYVQTLKPWTIKEMPADIIAAATRAARLEGVKVGQWLEAIVRPHLEQRDTGGTALVIARPPAPRRDAPGGRDLAEMLRVAKELSTGEDDPLMKDARRTVKRYLARERRG